MTHAEPSIDHRFWMTHVFWPACGFALALSLVGFLDLDRRIAHSFFYDTATNRWLANDAGLWWIRDFIHTGGRWFARFVAVFAIGIWLSSLCLQRLRSWRRGATYAVVALALTAGIVGGLKAESNVDCPWDLAEFGGGRPYAGIFSARPESLPRAACFPGAHAASGFAMVFGYFLLRDRSKRRALIALGLAIGIGMAFSFAQESRGAHFLSHDLASACIVWFLQVVLYLMILAPARGRVFQMRAVRI